MEMFNPPHPGEIVREDCLIPAGLSVTEAALRLGVSRQSMSELINGRNGISADMALRLEKAGWSTALSWLRNQASYDLWQARNRDEVPGWRALRAHRKTSQPKSSATVAEKAPAKKRATKKAAAKPPAPAKKRALKRRVAAPP
ncbi:MAG TPA: HigA family addiction module antitoxin [Roseiarcus sp.]|jgi:addiction module HigA family antidote|nr:HigA family addiction module antitoxin [Roseiarcus sp.]